MNCLIINNSQTETALIRSFAARTSFLVVEKCIANPTETLSRLYMNNLHADIVFFDLRMATSADMDFFKLLEPGMLFIFTSSDPAHALISYELNAVDFLLMPVTYERFLKSIQKAQEISTLRKSPSKNTSSAHTEKDEFIFLKSGNQIHKINIDDILYLEKDSNYFVVHFGSNRKLLIRVTFSELLSMLPVNKFMRVHKSYVIGFKHIDYIEGNNIIVNKEHIPIAITYKNEFMKVINA